jgi:hypothetical protein
MDPFASSFQSQTLYGFDVSPNLRVPSLPVRHPEPVSTTVSSKKEYVAAPPKYVPAEPPIKTTKKPSSYTKVIHDLAEDPSTNHFIGWTLDGRFLYVRDANMLCLELEKGRQFRSSKFASIVRNLNYHCFRKLRFDELDSDLRAELDHDSNLNGSRHLFYHPSFQRGRPDLLINIKSQKTEDAEKRNQEKNKVMKQMIPKNDSQSDILDYRVDFARKEAYYQNIIAQKDALIAGKDAEIEALHAALNTKRKRDDNVPDHYTNEVQVVDVNKSSKVDELVDYSSIFDSFVGQPYDDVKNQYDDVPELLEPFQL